MAGCRIADLRMVMFDAVLAADGRIDMSHKFQGWWNIPSVNTDVGQ